MQKKTRSSKLMILNQICPAHTIDFSYPSFTIYQKKCHSMYVGLDVFWETCREMYAIHEWSFMIYSCGSKATNQLSSNLARNIQMVYSTLICARSKLSPKEWSNSIARSESDLAHHFSWFHPSDIQSSWTTTWYWNNHGDLGDLKF